MEKKIVPICAASANQLAGHIVGMAESTGF